MRAVLSCKSSLANGGLTSKMFVLFLQDNSAIDHSNNLHFALRHVLTSLSEFQVALYM